MENTSDSFIPRLLLFCLKSERSVCYSVPDNTKTNIARTKILLYFGKRKIGEIEPRDIIAWQNELLAIRQPNGKPYSASYLQKIHSQLSAIFNHAVNFYHLPSNPAQKAGNMGKEEHREMLFWTKEEYLKFADAMMDKPVSYSGYDRKGNGSRTESERK